MIYTSFSLEQIGIMKANILEYAEEIANYYNEELIRFTIDYTKTSCKFTVITKGYEGIENTIIVEV